MQLTCKLCQDYELLEKKRVLNVKNSLKNKSNILLLCILGIMEDLGRLEPDNFDRKQNFLHFRGFLCEIPET